LRGNPYDGPEVIDPERCAGVIAGKRTKVGDDAVLPNESVGSKITGKIRNSSCGTGDCRNAGVESPWNPGTRFSHLTG